MENNTININVATGEITHSYTEPQPQQPIVINYDEEVVRLIRLRYDINRELKMINEQFLNPDQYREYREYVEQCKLKAQNMM